MADISVLICTLNDRICSVPHILLPQCEEVMYVVSFQYTDPMFLDMIPAVLHERSDVMVLPSLGVGLCANRNNALHHCTTRLAVIADDDTCYSLELLHEIIDTFLRDEILDVISFANNRLAFRLSPDLPQFDTRFGIGSAYLSCGEEEVLLHQAGKYGLQVKNLRFTSYDIDRSYWNLLSEDKRVRRSWGALQYMKHSTVEAFGRIVWKTLSLPRLREGRESQGVLREVSLRWHIFCDMLDGLRYIIRHPLNDSVAEEIPLDFQPIDIWRMP